MKRSGRERGKKRKVGSQQFAGSSGAYINSEPQKRGAGNRQDQCFGHHLIFMRLVAMIGGWIGRRRTTQGRKLDARDENRLVFSLGLLGDHHASTVSVGSMSECDRPPSQSSTIFGAIQTSRSDRFIILTMILRLECVRPVDNRLSRKRWSRRRRWKRRQITILKSWRTLQRSLRSRAHLRCAAPGDIYGGEGIVY